MLWFRYHRVLDHERVKTQYYFIIHRFYLYFQKVTRSFFFVKIVFSAVNCFFFFFFFLKKAPKYVSEHQTDDYLPGYTIACSLSRAFSVLEN